MTPATVNVFAHAAIGVPRSGKLLREINELNVASRVATVFWADELVVVKRSLLATSVDRAQLRHACEGVGLVAEEIGPLLASVYGGSTPFPAGIAAAEGENE